MQDSEFSQPLTRLFILDEHNKPAPMSDIFAWSEWFEKSYSQRRLKHTRVSGCLVSTVFLGLDHSYDLTREPVLYETMIFTKRRSFAKVDQIPYRSSTETEALEIHAATVDALKRKRFNRL